MTEDMSENNTQTPLISELWQQITQKINSIQSNFQLNPRLIHLLNLLPVNLPSSNQQNGAFSSIFQEAETQVILVTFVKMSGSIQSMSMNVESLHEKINMTINTLLKRMDEWKETASNRSPFQIAF